MQRSWGTARALFRQAGGLEAPGAAGVDLGPHESVIAEGHEVRDSTLDRDLAYGADDVKPHEHEHAIGPHGSEGLRLKSHRANPRLGSDGCFQFVPSAAPSSG
jgi:hypothetical protein